MKISLINYDRKHLLDSELIEFTRPINTRTGELKSTGPNGKDYKPHENAYYRGLLFKVYDDGPVFISGSLHKYWNEGLHNYNLFNYKSFLDVLRDLNSKFGITPHSCQLRSLELGVNVTPPIPTNAVIDNCLMHSTKPFEYKYHSNEGRYKQCEHSQYIIKLYNKALHYRAKGFDVKGEILRFEIKYKKMQILNSFGIHTIDDLVHCEWRHFEKQLIDQWTKILYAPSNEVDSTKKLISYQNVRYWTNLMTKGQRSLFYKEKKKLSEHLKKCKQDTHKTMARTISAMVHQMSSSCTI